MFPRRFRFAALTRLVPAESAASAQERRPDFPVPEEVTCRAADIVSEGTRMAAEVFAPVGREAERLPTIVMSHGWGGTAAAPRPDAIAFARVGY